MHKRIQPWVCLISKAPWLNIVWIRKSLALELEPFAKGCESTDLYHMIRAHTETARTQTYKNQTFQALTHEEHAKQSYLPITHISTHMRIYICKHACTLMQLPSATPVSKITDPLVRRSIFLMIAFNFFGAPLMHNLPIFISVYLVAVVKVSPGQVDRTKRPHHCHHHYHRHTRSNVPLVLSTCAATRDLLQPSYPLTPPAIAISARMPTYIAYSQTHKHTYNKNAYKWMYT